MSGLTGAKKNNLPITKIVHNVILIIRVVIEPKLVKSVDVVVLSKELLLIGGHGRGQLAIDMNAPTTTHTLSNGDIFGVSLRRQQLEALLRVRHREVLVGVLCST